MFTNVEPTLQHELQGIREAGLYKDERVITTTQGPIISTTSQHDVLNFCANNYLGLSSHPEVTEAAIEAIRTHGYGMSSVRFICGTQDIHKELERRIADFLGQEDCILYAAAFDANGGLFEPLLGEEDAIISDELNHASIIDGIRLCKAKRFRYKHNDMASLEDCLQQAQAAGARRKLIFTDGAFSMDGTIAQLDKICDLADRYDAMVGIDECHASGFLGRTGRGTHEYRGVMDRIDIITGTLGKALGGASGGFTAARKEIVDMLPTITSPPSAAATISIHTCVTSSSQRRSIMSASAPAGSPTSSSGRLPMVVSSATGTAEVVRLVMSRAAATPCISVPMFETSAASQSARKTG